MGNEAIAYGVVGVVLKKKSVKKLCEILDVDFNGGDVDENEITELMQRHFNVFLIDFGTAINQPLGETLGYYLAVSRLNGEDIMDGDPVGLYGLDRDVDEVNDAEDFELTKVMDALGKKKWRVESFVSFSLL